MVDDKDRTPVWPIWLLIAFGVVQPIAWILAEEVPRSRGIMVPLLAAWVFLSLFVVVATRRIANSFERWREQERTHRATLSENEQLLTQNAMLEIVGRSVDVPLAFQALAARIVRLVPCDRVGLALLSEDGREFQTYTARVGADERRSRPRPEVVFKIERTLIGRVVRTREPLIIETLHTEAIDHLDANVLVTAGFQSALVLPLVSKDLAVGTLNLVSRSPSTFQHAHIAPLLSIAEILAVAWVAQQLQVSLGRYRMMETMSESMMTIAVEINSALQTIVGHCNLIDRAYPDPQLQRDLGTIVRQAERIASLLEQMRAAAHERLQAISTALNRDELAMRKEVT